MLAPLLMDRVRRSYASIQNGFLWETDADIAAMIVRPHWGDNAGLMGGIPLAMSALHQWRRLSPVVSGASRAECGPVDQRQRRDIAPV